MNGSLQIKNDKYYMVVSYKDKDKAYKRKWIATGLETKGNKIKAEKMLKDFLENNKIVEIENEKESGVFNNFMLFQDYIDNWLKLRESNLSPNTMNGYWHIADRIRKYFKETNVTLGGLRPMHIEGYYAYLRRQGVGSNTIIHHHAVIRKALDFAQNNGIITENYADKVERPKKNRYFVNNVLNKEQVEKMFEVFKGTSVELPVYLAAFYGLRRSEVLGIKWSAINFENKSISICHKVVEVFGEHINGEKLIKSDILKNDSSNRTLPLFSQVEKLLVEAKNRIEINKQFYGKSYHEEDEEYICINEQGELIRPTYLTNAFERILEKNGLKHMRFHDLRHSCASLMLGEGVSMKQIQE